MKRPVTIHVILLLLALAAAYFVWTREPDSTEDEIEILNLRGGLDKAVYATPDRMVEVTKKKDDQGSYYWVKVETREPAPSKPEPPAPPKTDAGAGKDAGARPPAGKDAGDRPPAGKDDKARDAAPAAKPDAGPPAPPPEPAKIRKVQVFKGNSGLEEMIKGLASLSAVRSLGVVDEEKLKTFELAESKKTLTLVTGSAARVFIIGGNTFGAMDSYIQDKQDGRVYVVRPRLLQDFQYAEFRLLERDLHGFGDSEVDRVVFSTKAGQKVLLQQSRRDPAAAYWADEAQPDKRKDFFRNWMGRLGRLRVGEYVQPDSPPEGLSELFSAEYFVGSKKLGFLRWYKGPAAPPPAPPAGSTTPPPTAAEHYVETEHTRAKVKIAGPLGEEIERDLGNLLKE